MLERQLTLLLDEKDYQKIGAIADRTERNINQTIRYLIKLNLDKEYKQCKQQ